MQQTRQRKFEFFDVPIWKPQPPRYSNGRLNPNHGTFTQNPIHKKILGKILPHVRNGDIVDYEEYQNGSKWLCKGRVIFN